MKLLITGSGRSGTKWMAAFLQECGHKAGHESFRFGGQRWRGRGNLALSALRRGALPDLALIKGMIRQCPRNWIEVNGYLLFHVPTFLACRRGVLHLIRDGRDVVRSFMARRRAGRAMFGPPKGLDFQGQLAYRWAFKAHWMRPFQFLRIEDALADFDVLQAAFAPYGIAVDRAVWERMRKEKVNPTAKHKIAPWPGWTKEQRHTFRSVAGEMMRFYGYGADYPYRSQEVEPDQQAAGGA